MVTAQDNPRRQSDTRIAAIEKRLDEGAARMGNLEGMVSDVHEIIVAARGFFRTLGYVGTVVKWLVGVGTAIAAIYAAWKTGKPYA